MLDFSELPFSMPLASALAGRRSVRDYKHDVLTRGQVASLLAAAVRAPTAMHQEAWSFVVVQDPKMIERLSERAKPLFAQLRQRRDLHHRARGAGAAASPAGSIFYNASTLILVCGLRDAPFIEADCWLAAGNILLAAHAAGLGSCVIGSALAALDLDDIRAELGIPPSHVVVAPIIVGVPAAHDAPTARQPPHVLHWLHDSA